MLSPWGLHGGIWSSQNKPAQRIYRQRHQRTIILLVEQRSQITPRLTETEPEPKPEPEPEPESWAEPEPQEFLTQELVWRWVWGILSPADSH
jgi:hypothetical protein